jgi:hypothetical protein
MYAITTQAKSQFSLGCANEFGSHLEHLNICTFFENADILFSPLSLSTSAWSTNITTVYSRSFHHLSLPVLFGHPQDCTPKEEKEDHLCLLEVSQSQT